MTDPRKIVTIDYTVSLHDLCQGCVSAGEGDGAMKPQIDRTSEVYEALARLDEISKRSRHLGILLATYPVEDVERRRCCPIGWAVLQAEGGAMKPLAIEAIIDDLIEEAMSFFEPENADEDAQKHSSPKHLGRYVDEFAFRLNEGNVAHHTLTRLGSFIDGVAGKRLTYKALIA